MNIVANLLKNKNKKPVFFSEKYSCAAKVLFVK